VTSIAQMTLADDPGGGDVERGKQRRRAAAAVIARTAVRRAERHRHVQFLGTIEAHVPADLDLHLILDKYSTDKTPRVRRWFVRHPLFHLHFTPTSASWLNLVERWFLLLSQRSRAARTEVSAHRSPSYGRRTLTRSLPWSLEFVIKSQSETIDKIFT